MSDSVLTNRLRILTIQSVSAARAMSDSVLANRLRFANLAPGEPLMTIPLKAPVYHWNAAVILGTRSVSNPSASYMTISTFGIKCNPSLAVQS